MEQKKQESALHIKYSMSTDLYNVLTDFRSEMNDRFDGIETKFVSMDRFKPVEMVVYGMAGFVLITVLGIIVSFAVVKASPTTASSIAKEVTPVIQAIGGTMAVK